jgi:hypothetical protein
MSSAWPVQPPIMRRTPMALFQLPGDDNTLALVADRSALERRCCPFFEFTVGISSSDSCIRVALTGSPEVKTFLESEVRSHVVAPPTRVRSTRQ